MRRACRVCAKGFLFPAFLLALHSTCVEAGDLTISSARTKSFTTSAATSSGSGDITISSTGYITVDDDAVAVTIDSDNAVTNKGHIYAYDEDGMGILVSSDTSGGIINTGTIITGTAEDDDDDAVMGGPAIEVNADLGEGIENTGAITTYGAYAVLFNAESQDLTVGTTDTDDVTTSFYNDGTIYAYGYTSSTSGVTAIGVEGSGYTATLADGIYNDEDGTILAYAYDQDATGIAILDGGVVSSIVNEGLIEAYTTEDDDIGGDAVAIYVASGGSLESIENDGTIYAYADVDGTSATAIRDASGTLNSIVNTGTILAEAGDTGDAIAIDLSEGDGTADIENSGDITGDFLFGGGDYTLTSTDGTLTGAIVLDGGTLAITLSGGTEALMSSSMASGSTLTLDVEDASFDVAEDGVFYATSANFSSDSTFLTSYNATAGTSAGYLSTSGATSFDDGATIDVNFTSYLSDSANILIAEAGSLSGVDDVVIGGVSVGYDAELVESGTSLYLVLSRKTAAALGYTGNLAAIYNVAPTALETDDDLGSAIGNVETVAELKQAYEQLMPDITGARERNSILTQDMAHDAISDRLSELRGLVRDRSGRRHRSGWWGREAGSAIDKSGDNNTSYDGYIFGLTIGYDAIGPSGNVTGFAFSTTSEGYSGDYTGDDDSALRSYALHFYKGYSSGPLFWDMTGGLSYNSYTIKREIAIGDIDYTATSDSSGFQGMAGADFGYRAKMGWFVLTPSLQADYSYLHMGSYEESGAGGANLGIDAGNFQSLRLKGSLRAALGEGLGWRPYLEGGYTSELLTQDAEVDGHFLSGGSFSLTGDEIDESAPFVKAGLTYQMLGGSFSLSYKGEFGDFSAHQASVTASLQF